MRTQSIASGRYDRGHKGTKKRALAALLEMAGKGSLGHCLLLLQPFQLLRWFTFIFFRKQTRGGREGHNGSDNGGAHWSID
jgi:hypothetical protein